jgi:hypothetical protein
MRSELGPNRKSDSFDHLVGLAPLSILFTNSAMWVRAMCDLAS